LSVPQASIDPEEVARFSAQAEGWWDPKGKFAPLHRFNPVRLAFIREQALAQFERDPAARRPFEGLRLLDIGCGGGLLAEPMSRLGFAVTAIDPSERNIEVAQAHASEGGLPIAYRRAAAEDLLSEGALTFDVVLNMEVIEHAADPGAFLRDAARLIAPGGLMILATLNRTLRGLALGKFAAEYVLRWLPRGTHDWRRFVKPEEIDAYLAGESLEIAGPFGVAFNPLTGAWSRSEDVAVNYLMTIGRPARP
jgi:2-polyprenyl-6-hydroxyphenyl methylase/3-demethylubiquinone-9 3-methyltransferase